MLRARPRQGHAVAPHHPPAEIGQHADHAVGADLDADAVGPRRIERHLQRRLPAPAAHPPGGDDQPVLDQRADDVGDALRRQPRAPRQIGAVGRTGPQRLQHHAPVMTADMFAVGAKLGHRTITVARAE